MSDHYILDENKNPKPANLHEWAKWFEGNRNRIVKQETVGDAKVSTVFLGLDHSWGIGPPILWETMVFGGKYDQEQDRCSGGWIDALQMHERMVAKVREEYEGNKDDLTTTKEEEDDISSSAALGLGLLGAGLDLIGEADNTTDDPPDTSSFESGEGDFGGGGSGSDY
jgi:hypothetical protein